ncbi:MAG: hypothetical protein AAB910_00160 [Patescibacteria group bacterium]
MYGYPKFAPPGRKSVEYTIITEVRDGATYAYLLGMPEISGIGQNEAGALGHLLINHAPKLGISIRRHD